MTQKLSIDELRLNFSYDPETGVFTRLVDHVVGNGAVRARAGDEVRAGNGKYRRLHVGTSKVYAHRAAWALTHGVWPDRVDHINGNPTDNRICNLRACNASQNGANARLAKTNKSGFKGVCWHKGGKKWVAQIKIKGERLYLGLFECPIEAHKAYMAVAVARNGNFARAA